MRYLKTENDYLQYLEEIDGKIINSASFPFGSVYFRVSNGTKLTFYLGSSNEPYKKEIFNLDFPISFNGEFYQNYADAEEVLGELFGSPSKELKDKVEEIEDNLNTALTNLENNTEDIEVLQDQMEQKADLSEVYTQERVDLLLNLKVDNSTLQNQYYNKDTTDAKLGLKADKADTYNKTDVNSLLDTKASKDEVDLLETEVDSINDDLLLKANKADVYTKTQTDNLLGEKANINSVYNKSEVDIKLDEKADREYTYSKDEINGLLDEKANYETIQGIEGSINNINDAISNHQSQLDNKADKEWTETEISSLWSSNSNHQVQLDSKANRDEVYSKSETEELLNGKANTSDLDGKQDTLVSQANIKSIQNHDILGEGNIELFSMMNQADYDAMVEMGEVDNSKLYLIPDNKRVYFQGTLIIDGSATPTPTPTGETETMVTFYYTDSAEGDYVEYTQLKGIAPYTITREAVFDCLNEAIAKEGIARTVTKIELSDGVHRIDNEAFSGFTSLKEVKYGANLREMGSSAFTHCTSLTNLVIPDSVTGETDFTFTECSNATTCYVGTGITKLGGDTFCDCEKLTSCHIPSNVTNLGSEHGGVFARCYALTSVTIDGQIDHIGSNTFLETNSLTELWLTGCTNVPSVESDTFVLGNPSNVTVHIPCNMTDAYQMTPFWDIFTDHYVEEGCGEPTGETETHVIFYDENGDEIASLEGLSPYSITQSAVEGLGESVKENCRKVLFGYNVKSIGEKAFVGFDKVSEWTIQKIDATEIGNFAFARTDNSTVRTFIFTNSFTPLNTETLGNNVFDRKNEGLMSLAADENTYFKLKDCDAKYSIDDVFANKGGYYDDYIGRTSSINDDECEEPTGETEGKLVMTLYTKAPDEEGSVAYEVYQNDGETIKQALDRYLGDTFGYGGDYDDQRCREFKSSITHVSFSNNITQIESTNVGLFGYGTDAGYGEYDGGWNNIESVTLPSNLQTIGNYVFQIMPKVSQWNIPSTVTSIGDAAFQRRTQDPNVNRTIRFNGDQHPTMGNSVFDIVDEEMMVGADTNQTFKVNCGYLSEYSSAFNNMGGSYEIYSVNGLITEDCAEPEPTGETEGKLVMTLYTKAPDEEGTVPYEVYQNDGETIKQALYRFLTDRFDDDTSMNNFKDSITHVVFDNSVTEISGECMFSYSRQSNLHDAHWRNVESVTLPNNLITIGSFTFEDMPKVSYWNIPSTVQRVSSLAFLRVNTNPNVFREIRFNTYGCDPPTFELYNKWSVFDIENEETIDVDTNQKITCERNAECLEEFTEYFNHLGSNYAEYVTNGVLQPDECH